MITFRGTVHLTNSKEIATNALLDQSHKCMILDMDDQSSELENMFPTAVVKATILLPPPSAIFREIDGDRNGFADEYMAWLTSDTVSDYVASILLLMANGIDVIFYCPEYSEDSLWVNQLLSFFEMMFGIHIGTSSTNRYGYNPAFNVRILDVLYIYNCIDAMMYIYNLPLNLDVRGLNQNILTKLTFDLHRFGSKNDTVFDIIHNFRMTLSVTQKIPQPVISFD